MTAPAAAASLQPVRATPWWPASRALARRSLVSLARNPAASVPGLVFPLFFAAVNSAALDRATSLPGFPDVDSFLTFLLPATLLQGVMLSATTAGNDVAIDLQDGFFDRLLASPINRVALLLGRLGGTFVYAAVLAVVFTAIMMLFGATLAAGPAGLAVVVVTAALFGTGMGAFSMAVGFRTGSVERVNAFFPIFFTVIFLSSAFFPPELTGGWFEAVARVNPVSWMINGLRHLVIVGWDSAGAALAVSVAAGIAVACVALAAAALRSRLRQ
jgi:ABC-2 type transport system permease protein